MNDLSEITDLSERSEHLDTMKSMYKELMALGPCPDDRLGKFKLSKTLKEVDCAWFASKNTKRRCKNHIEGELLCNSICGRYNDECNSALFPNGEIPTLL
jgi:hypothetical protein